MGAVTFTKATPGGTTLKGGHGTPVIDNKRVVRGTLTFSASYATGGDTLDLKTVGLTELTYILVDATAPLGNISGLSILLGGTKIAPLISAFDSNATQVTSTTDLSARTAIPVWLLGS